jgi:PII-like signaling protein
VTGLLKLTAHFGERDRTEGRFLADAMIDACVRHRVATSVLLRGAEGFGARHHLRTDRLLSLSEDLPVVAVALDAPARIEALLPDLAQRLPRGLITLERAADVPPTLAPHEEVQLTVYAGRGARLAGQPVHVAVVERLRRHGMAGATVLLGVDGTLDGARRRARFRGGNARVPLMVIAVGARAAAAAAAEELASALPGARLTLERVLVCRRDGVGLAAPPVLPDADERRQRLTVYVSEQARADGVPLYQALVRGLRAEGSLGATALRGIWGFHGDHAPHGDTPWQLRRRVPVVVSTVDAPARIRRAFPVIEALCATTGLVTSEVVPTVVDAAAVGTGFTRSG